MIKKIFGVIVILGLAVGSFFGIYFGVKFDKVNKQLKSDIEYIQTIDTLNKELSQTKNDYIKLNDNYVVVVAENELNKKEVDSLKISIQEKEEIIQGLQSTITEKVNKISEIETEKSILETEKEDLLSQIETMTEEQISELARLNNKISDLEKEKSTLTSEKAELQTQYDNMLVEKNNLLLDKQTLENRIEDNNKKIANYESQILQLQNEITRLTTLLESYEELINETHIVTFYIGDEIYSAKAVRYGKTISEFENPQETNSYIFNYWTLDHETEVDILTMPITEDVSVYANYTPKYKVEFESVGEMISTQYIVDGQSVQTIESPVREGYKFLGWSLDGESLIQIENFVPSENIKFIAVFEYELIYNVNFFVNNELYYTKRIKLNEKIEGVVNPCIDTLEFDGWTLNGQIVDLSTYSVTENLNFFAQFSEAKYGLFDENNNVIFSWSALKNYGYLKVTKSKDLYCGSNHDAGNLTGILKISDEVVAAGGGIQADAPFQYFGHLNAVIFTNSLKTIYKYGLYDTDADYIYLGENIRNINNLAFAFCKSLKSIYLPSSIFSFGAGTSKSDTPFFACSSTCVLYYNTATWNTYFYWYYYGSNNTSKLSTKSGYTYEQYLTETGAIC